MGQEERALQTARDFETAVANPKLFGQPPPAVYFRNQEFLRLDLPTYHAVSVSEMNATRGAGAAIGQIAPYDAEILTLMHEYQAADTELQTSPDAQSEPVAAKVAYDYALINASRGDFHTAYNQVQIADRKASQDAAIAVNFFSPPTCLAGKLAEMNGLHAVADADIQRGGRFEDCYRFKADIADHRGQWPQAQKDYAAAVALAPSMPSGYFSWGDAFIGHRDYPNAIIKFKLANEKGGHWADPLKRWGDALVWMRRSDLALVKYEEASKYAPRWGGLYVAWGKSLDYLGRHSEAVEKYRGAQTMDLTGDEHWALRGCCS